MAKEQVGKHTCWMVTVGPDKMVFTSLQAANKAADVIESHTGHLTEVEKVSCYQNEPDLRELIRLIQEARPKAL